MINIYRKLALFLSATKMRYIARHEQRDGTSLHTTNYALYTLLFTVFIIGGIFLRFYNLRYNTQFNWDQENSLAYPARDILVNHHLTLIGPRTSVGGFYLGPFYTYYVTAFYALFDLDPISGAVSAAVLATITIIFGYILVSSYFGKHIGILFALIWSVSTFVISFDRIPWNVNLFPLCSLLVLMGALLAKEKRYVTGYLSMGIGVLLGVSSHFSVIFLFSIVCTWLLLHRTLWNKYILILIVCILIGILPLVVFEYRHGFLMTQGTTSFASSVFPEAKYIPERVIFLQKLSCKTQAEYLQIICRGGCSYRSRVSIYFYSLR
jgi:4-amino-4-deoxy-L-arabinose transferase-like glycosyltransferase